MLIKFKEKWDDRFVQSDIRESIFAHVLQDRINDGFWFDEQETALAKQAILDKKAELFMQSRRDYEYEGYEQVSVENV